MTGIKKPAAASAGQVPGALAAFVERPQAVCFKSALAK